MNWISPLDKGQNVFTDKLLSPAAFDSIAQIIMTWTNESIHWQYDVSSDGESMSPHTNMIPCNLEKVPEIYFK